MLIRLGSLYAGQLNRRRPRSSMHLDGVCMLYVLDSFAHATITPSHANAVLIRPSTHRKASTRKLLICRSALNSSSKTTATSVLYVCEENMTTRNSKVPCSASLPRWRESSRSSRLIRNLPGKARNFLSCPSEFTNSFHIEARCSTLSTGQG
jgi:hypothetical protein